MVESSHVWEVHVERMDSQTRVTTLYRCVERGQLELVASEEWGPFDTSLEISQWVWKWVTRSMDRHQV